MSARDPVSSLTTHLGMLSDLLHRNAPEQALAKFSRYLEGRPLDVLSRNAINYTTQKLVAEPEAGLFSRIGYVKGQIAACVQHLAETAAPKLRNRALVVHPVDALGAQVIRNARSVRFFAANPDALKRLPNAQAHHPFSALSAIERADLVLLEPRAITAENVIASQGSRLLIELARARGIPVYALATSWHATAVWESGQDDELIDPAAFTGVISEHGIYAHDQFLARAQKTFPWLF